MKTGDKTITYQYDSNGNRIKSSGQDESLDYIYDTENRLLAVKDKEGMLFAALYDGDDNRVSTASRTQATNTYQLFKRAQKKGKAKSPKTSPNGEENSIFWYGFSQNVLQFLSSFASSQGYDWRETFDTISVAYHQKVAKDRATKEGLVVHPPNEDNLPGQDPVTYASEVQDVLIPYTTKEDTYNYYEVRNYINDINQENAQVLETYDDQHKARETYTYGNGRASYHNNQTGDTYNYLTSVSGSVTGLTKDGSSVASSSYQLYGATKESTDQTGNPFAYNGEARDITGLDYLRARYYDNQVGTFLTEDSYQGDDQDPLSQNLYSYVQNNSVNYTDPSGHKAMGMLGGGGRATINTRNQRKYSQTMMEPSTFGRYSPSDNRGYYTAANYIRQRVQASPTYRAPASYYSAFGPNAAVYRPTPSYTPQGTYYGGVSANQYAAYQQAQAQARAEAQRKQNIQNEYAQATGIKGTPKSKEAKNMFLNWGKSLKQLYTHVCKTAKRIKNDTVKMLKKVDWKKVGIVAVATVAAVGATVLTAGVAGPAIAGLMGVSSTGLALGTVSTGALIATGIGTGMVSGAIGGGTYALTSGVLSGNKPKDILANVNSGMVNSMISGGLTGGLMSAFSGSTAALTNPLARHTVDTVGETAIDTIADAAQGGKVTPASLATSLVFNAATEGITSKIAKGQSAKPTQQLALPAPKQQSKPDFYVAPDGTTYFSGDSTLSGTVVSNVGKSYDITPSDIHGVVNRNPKPVGGIPNSSLDILDSSTGELLTRRFYDSSGKAYRDIDFTHHGNIGTHREAPHEHFWTFSPNGGIVRK